MADTVLAAAKRGDKEAFLSLVEPLETRLYQTALGILGVRQDAEDAWQNAVIQAWRGVHRLREPYFATWLTRIVINEAKQVLRKRGSLPLAREHTVDIPHTDENLPDKLYVHSLLQRLSNEQRQAIVLRFWLELSLEEMADVLGVPLSTAKTRLYQGLATLKTLMKEVDRSE